MRPACLSVAIAALLAAGAGCGKQIGDPCVVSSDCSLNGDRVCDSSSKEGYCTVVGCDYNTCPVEATCVRFFSGGYTNKPCDQTTEGTTTHACLIDELCSLDGQCVPRAAESRYCMRTCQVDTDCRDGYECRTLELMKSHGGEPVLAPGLVVDATAPKFCALAPALQ
jgi:hypothetical protein